MNRWSICLCFALALCGCAIPRLYDAEPVDKSNASLISAAYVKALIRPIHTDKSVEARITDDGIWVSSGTFVVRYACYQPDQDVTQIHNYPYEKTIRIEAGYHYQVNCFHKKNQLTLENIGWQDVNYHTYAEALYEVPLDIRFNGELWQSNTFRYEYYNDWGGEGDIIFTISRDPMNGEFSADLRKYKYSVALQAMSLYDQGVRTRKDMLKDLEKTSYQGTADQCPKLQFYYDHLFDLMKAKALEFAKQGPVRIYTDSPPIYRYYFSNGPNEMMTLDIMDDKDALYKATHIAMAYVQSCGEKGN